MFHAFLSSADFFKITFFRKSFRNTIRVSNSLNPDQAQHFVGPDLGPNCLQRLSADDTNVTPDLGSNCLQRLSADDTNVTPDLGPNCLQRLSADDTSR